MRKTTLLALVMFSLHAAVLAEPRSSIAFESYEIATRSAGPQTRPLAVYFTASWCGSCKKMQANTLMDEGVIEASQRFRWARVDIDDQPEIAARFGVRGVPALFLLDEHGKLLAARSGFQDAPSLKAFLAPSGAAPAAQKAPPLTAANLEAALQRIAASRLEERPELQEQVLQLKALAWPGLLDGMRSGHLALRAAAYDLLRESTHQTLPYDAFAPKAERDMAVSAWQAWCDAH